jgi:hypothetical protein
MPPRLVALQQFEAVASRKGKVIQAPSGIKQPELPLHDPPQLAR